MIRVRSRGLLVGVVLAAASSACTGSSDDGGPDGGSDGTGTPDTETLVSAPDGGLADPCALLTVQEIDAATGQSFAPAVPHSDLSTDVQAICDWSVADGSPSTVQVIVSGDVYDSNRVGAEEAGEELVDVEVAGADDAFSTLSGSIVAMDVDGAFVQVSYITDSTIDLTDVTVELAEAVVGRL